MAKMGQVVLRHSCREGNEAAHLMAKEGPSQSTINKLLRFAAPPSFVESKMLEDKERIVILRNLLFSVCKSLAELGNIDALPGICGNSNAAWSCNSAKLLKVFYE